MDNTREFYRWQLRLPCDLSIQDGAIEASIENLSFRGALIEGGLGRPEPGAVLRLKIHFICDVELLGRIVHCQPKRNGGGSKQQIGLRFVGPTEKLVEKLLPLFRTFVSGQESKLVH